MIHVKRFLTGLIPVGGFGLFLYVIRDNPVILLLAVIVICVLVITYFLGGGILEWRGENEAPKKNRRR